MNMSKSPLVLIVDDDDQLVKTLAQVVSTSGFDTIMANNGNDAFDLFISAVENNSRIDAIVSDVDMARGSGTDLIRKIRSLNHSIPFFFMTGGYGMDESEAQALSANGIFMKPFGAADLIAALRASLGIQPERLSDDPLKKS